MDKDVKALVSEISAKIEESKAEQKKMADDLFAANGKVDEEAKAALEKANESAEKVAGIAQILDLEQKLAGAVQEGKASAKTLGQIVAKSDEFKAFANGSTNRARIEANTITGQEGSYLKTATRWFLLTALARLFQVRFARCA